MLQRHDLKRRYIDPTKHPAFLSYAAPAHRVLLAVRMKRDDKNGIDERSFRFFSDVLAFVETIPVEPKTKKIIEQLVGASGSIGANREEALGGSSRDEFIRFNEISLRGANESVRWLRSCAVRRLGAQPQCVALLDEGRQLARILGKIVVTSKRHSPDPKPKPKPKPRPTPTPKT